MSSYVWQGPLTKTGVIDVFKQKYLTPSIGSEFSDLDLVEALKSPNADTLFRDLAITGKSLSERISITSHQDASQFLSVVLPYSVINTSTMKPTRKSSTALPVLLVAQPKTM